VLALTALIGLSTPAQAAGGTAPDLRVCMKYSNGSAYAGKLIYLYRHDGTNWANTGRSQTANSNGCTTFVDVLGGRWFYAQGWWSYSIYSAIEMRYYIYYYDGYSQSIWVPASTGDRLTSDTSGVVHGPYRSY
jgi:hypothetical protein